MRDPGIEDYLNQIADKLGELGGRFYEGPTVEFHEDLGILRLGIRFHDDSRLEVDLAVKGPVSFPDWRAYSVHYMTAAGTCILRYDNSYRHRRTKFFPHHKHVGRAQRVVDHPRPTISSIVDEIRSILYP